MPRAGTPYKTDAERRDTVIQLRMNAAELKKLDEAAAKLSLTRAALIRTAIEKFIADE